MATISQQIATIDAQIAAHNADIAANLQSAKNWRDSKSQCSGTKSKKAECEAGKEAQAVIKEQYVESVRALIAKLESSKQSLVEAQKAENTMGIKLADQGISQAAALITADGNAKAAITAAQIKSTAEAEAITKEADTSSFQSTAIIGIVGLLVVVVVIVVVKKYAGKKKGKSKP